jgi:phosphatidylglycerophosphate synthase
MFDDLLRRLKDRLFTPLAARIGRRVHPNVLSVVALAFGVAVALLAARRQYEAALACWGANRLLDGLDGTLARVSGQQSDFGGYLDILLDFVVYAAVPVGLAHGAGTPGVVRAALWLEAAFFVNAASWMYLAAVLERRAAGAQARGELTTVTMPPGVIAGAETVLFYALFLMFPGRLTTLFTIMAALVGVNVVQRLIWAARKL